MLSTENWRVSILAAMLCRVQLLSLQYRYINSTSRARTPSCRVIGAGVRVLGVKRRVTFCRVLSVGASIYSTTPAAQV